MRAAIDCVGTFGLLTALYRVVGKDTKNSYWRCKCACGTEVTATSSQLRGGSRIDCGSRKHRIPKHNGVGTREYSSWAAAKSRCNNPNTPQWNDYGGRGITMCPEWQISFKLFREYMGPCPEGYSIDRIDFNGNYEPGNCRWANDDTQARNSRRVVATEAIRNMIHELKATVSQANIAEIVGVSISTVNRIIRGVSWA